ncbi:hypothetical protein AGOR_G00032990 [Albula goreensis]|uniref:G-protein coupled receptors family 1 profile domain-containing protein n=1 Tax=Albula goreensis TaxID=1534307 RepID=A0A8T3DY72_9TELE|nr:hypothetical protein AGOR_G00032990 [Albula goreensis]
MSTNDNESQIYDIIVRIFYTAITTMGLLGNALFVAVFWRRERGRRRPDTEASLLQLAIANVLLLATHPFFPISRSSKWTLSTWACPLLIFLNQSTFSACVLLLAAVAIHQCLAVSLQRDPTGRPPSPRLVPRALQFLLLWVLAVACSLPELFLYSVQVIEGKEQCSLHKPVSPQGSALDGNASTELGNVSTMDGNVSGLDSSLHLLGYVTFFLQLVLTFLAPAAAITICYVSLLRTVCATSLNHKKKVYHGVVALLTAFYAFQLPRLIWALLSFQPEIESESVWIYMTSILFCCANPLIYAVFWRKFRAGARKLLCGCSCLGNPQTGQSEKESTESCS